MCGMIPLETYLKHENVDARFIDKANTVHTADAAEATGIPLEYITKSLVCLGDDGKAYVAVIPGPRKLRPKEVARVFGLKKVRLCPFDEAHQYSGYPPGATPPLHYRNVAGVVMDASLLQLERMYGGGGTNERLLEIATADAVRLNQARVADITEVPA
jgi:Cys-tRNA(Pro)/Cys-tRNA(Cys) deacylase